VMALVTEAGHLRQAMDGILREMLRRDEQNAELLAGLLVTSQQLPSKVVELLRPEFDRLRQAEARIVAKLAEVGYRSDGGAEEGQPARAERLVEETTGRGGETLVSGPESL
jgi:hypothetical protein